MLYLKKALNRAVWEYMIKHDLDNRYDFFVTCIVEKIGYTCKHNPINAFREVGGIPCQKCDKCNKWIPLKEIKKK